MSRVRNVRLTVDELANDQWRVDVSYEARFTSLELDKNIRFRERITLLGQDRVVVAARNRRLDNITTRVEDLITFNNGVRPSARTQQINRSFTVNADVLDEDDGSEVAGVINIPELSTFNNPADEILAQVELIPIGVSRAENRSAVLRENF